MRLIVSFLLSLFFYSILMFFFILILKIKHKENREVLVHTAIIVDKKNNFKKKETSKNIIKNKTSFSKHSLYKNTKSKKDSSSSFTRGGNSDFKDIFKAVKYNVRTEKIKHKKSLSLSRFKGIENNLKKVKLINLDVSYVNSSKTASNKEVENLISEKLSPIWYLISNRVGEYAKINIVYDRKEIKVYIIDTNLSLEKQNLLIEKIKNLKFNKPFDITVKFITKVKK
jgi:hypothetical protein